MSVQKKFPALWSATITACFTVIEAYGARRMKSFLGKSFLGIVRSTILIGPDGKVEKVWESAKSKGHAAEVVEALKTLQ